jgi:hypothetical protein
MRVFLTIFSFVNAFLYFMLYAFFDNILMIIGGVDSSQGFLVFIKIVIIVLFGFLIGLIVTFLQNIPAEKSFFDYKIAIIVGILPFIFLILSGSDITNFLAVHLFGSNRHLSELLFYFFSRQIVFALWLGFAVGVSVRISFKRKLKHEMVYNMENEIV